MAKVELPFKVGDKFVFRGYKRKRVIIQIDTNHVEWEYLDSSDEKGLSYHYDISMLLRWIKIKELILISNKIEEILYA